MGLFFSFITFPICLPYVCLFNALHVVSRRIEGAPGRVFFLRIFLCRWTVRKQKTDPQKFVLCLFLFLINLSVFLYEVAVIYFAFFAFVVLAFVLFILRNLQRGGLCFSSGFLLLCTMVNNMFLLFKLCTWPTAIFFGGPFTTYIERARGRGCVERMRLLWSSSSLDVLPVHAGGLYGKQLAAIRSSFQQLILEYVMFVFLHEESTCLMSCQYVL